MMRRLLQATGGAMALLMVLAGNAFGYLHVDYARFGGAAVTGDVHRFTIAQSGYNPAAAYAATPATCFDSQWHGQFSNQGCWRRVNDNWIVMQFGYDYFAASGRPLGRYEVWATGDDGCFRVSSLYSSQLRVIYWPSGSPYYVPAFERYIGC